MEGLSRVHTWKIYEAQFSTARVFDFNHDSVAGDCLDLRVHFCVCMLLDVLPAEGLERVPRQVSTKERPLSTKDP